MRELALFAGAGGGILGSFLIGWTTVCAVEIDPFCRSVLLARQRDGVLPRFPIWDDVRTFDGQPWRGRVDVISGGFPCQDISSAGQRTGISGERSGLWSEYARIIREVGPAHVIVENSPDLVTRGLGTVLGDLAAGGYHGRWDVLAAAHAGAPHERKRLWIVAHSDRQHGHARLGRPAGTGARPLLASGHRSDAGLHRSPWLVPRPGITRMADGVAAWVDRTRAIGNGQVPAVVRLAWEGMAA